MHINDYLQINNTKMYEKCQNWQFLNLWLHVADKKLLQNSTFSTETGTQTYTTAELDEIC